MSFGQQLPRTMVRPLNLYFFETFSMFHFHFLSFRIDEMNDPLNYCGRLVGIRTSGAILKLFQYFHLNDEHILLPLNDQRAWSKELGVRQETDRYANVIQHLYDPITRKIIITIPSVSRLPMAILGNNRVELLFSDIALPRCHDIQ